MYRLETGKAGQRERKRSSPLAPSTLREFPPHRLGDGRRRRRLGHGRAPREQRRAEHPVVEGQGPAQYGEGRGRGRERELPDKRL